MSLLLHAGMVTGLSLAEAVDSILGQPSIDHADRVDLALAVKGWPSTVAAKEVVKIAMKSGPEDDIHVFAAILDSKGLDQERLKRSVGAATASEFIKAIAGHK